MKDSMELVDVCEQQGIYEAAQQVATAINEFIDAICNLFDEVIKVVTEAILSICVVVKKYNCNNWRRMHGMPLLHRNKKCRQGRMFHRLIL